MEDTSTSPTPREMAAVAFTILLVALNLEGWEQAFLYLFLSFFLSCSSSVFLYPSVFSSTLDSGGDGRPTRPLSLLDTVEKCSVASVVAVWWVLP